MLAVLALVMAQQQQLPAQGEMLMTSAGFLAISTPPGFARVDGPAEAVFTPRGEKFGKASAFIYVGTATLGKTGNHKDLNAFIDEDVAAFRQRFPKGDASKEPEFAVPFLKRSVPVWTFRSGEKKNAFERLVFLQDTDHLVWLLVLSANDAKSFEKARPAFDRFVQSYGGSIYVGNPPGERK